MGQRLQNCRKSKYSEHMSREHIGGAAGSEQLMVRENSLAKGCDEGHRIGPRSPFGARLSEAGQLSSRKAEVTIVDTGKREVGYENADFLTLLDHTFDVERVELHGCGTRYSPQPTTYWCMIVPRVLTNLS